MSGDEVRPTISVIVPAYNARSHIGETLSAIFGQTYPPTEVIVVDDGSTDATGDYVAAAFAGARIIRTTNGGPSKARNRGAMEATGEWLAFCDADDVWLPWRLEVQAGLISSLERDGVDRVGLICGHSMVAATNRVGRVAERAALTGRPPSRKSRTIGLSDMLVNNKVSSSTVLIRAEVFKQLGGFDPGVDGAEDLDLWLRIAAESQILLIPVRLSVYRSGPVSYSKNTPRLTRAIIRILERWSTGPPGLVEPSHYRRACTRRILSLVYRHAIGGLEVPEPLWAFRPVHSPLHSPGGAALWAFRTLPALLRPASSLYRALRVVRKALRLLREGRGAP